MSIGEQLFAPRDDLSSRPSFEVVLRGYDRRQVDLFVEQVEKEISTLAIERERALGQIQDLTTQLQQLQAELTELRQRPAKVDRASFRDLGPMVDQILALAEKQAEAITEAATQQADELRAEAERVLAEAREQAVQASRELEAELAARWSAAEQEITERRAAVEQDLNRQRATAEQKAASLIAEAQQYSAELRQRADEQAAAQQQQLNAVTQEIQEQRQVLSQVRSELDITQQRLIQSQQQAAATDREVGQLRQRLDEVRQELNLELQRLDEARREAEAAERHAKEVRARVRREAKRVADLAAAAVLAAASDGSQTAEYPVVRPASDSATGRDSRTGQGGQNDQRPDPATDEATVQLRNADETMQLPTAVRVPEPADRAES